MRQISLVAITAIALVCCASAQQNGRTYAGATELAARCNKASGILSKDGKLRKKTETDTGYSAGQCIGYVEGVLDGIDGTDYTSDGKTFQVRVESISNEWDVVAAFLKDLADNPLDKNKTAEAVLLKVLLANGLVASIEKPQVLTTSEQ
jgi:hypothetical protein